MKIKLNNEEKELSIPKKTPALWAIREECGDQSIKFGCGKGHCGACTILVDGLPKKSCITRASRLKNKDIKTLKSAPSDKLMQMIQNEWIKLNVAQCGYCQSGQMLAAYGLLKSNNNPTQDEIQEWMSGNICRCGTYPRIFKAIANVASKQNQGQA